MESMSNMSKEELTMIRRLYQSIVNAIKQEIAWQKCRVTMRRCALSRHFVQDTRRGRAKWPA